jgi:exodeoxyribonuclease VII large subunit
MEDLIYTVTELNREVKIYVEENPFLQNFFLRGEMSNITYYKSGHLYFTLKDEKSSVKCAIFHYKMKRVPEDLKEGDSVKIFGKVSIYESSGQYQVLGDFLEKENKVGSLYEKMEKLKRELAEKGYFDSDKKKPLPYLPLTIGVVTSPTGAAIRDIIDTARKRFPGINIYIYPAKVQGDGAEKEIAKGIEVLNKIAEIDIIVAGRGGGSIEDLWSFNTKEVAMAIHKSKKPIISAVGHEIDFLISDLVADVRAATPTQSMEIAVKERAKIEEMLMDRLSRAGKALRYKFENCKSEIKKRRGSYIIKRFEDIIPEKINMLVDREKDIINVMEYKIERLQNIVNNKKDRVEDLNPKNILKRGYSITLKDGKAVTKSSDLKIGDSVETIFFRGKVKSEIKILD